MKVELDSRGDWFAVRCIFGTDVSGLADPQRLYEERVTIWRASDQDAAIELAEAEAHEYATGLNLEHLGLAQCFELPEAPANGSEARVILGSILRHWSVAPTDLVQPIRLIRARIPISRT